MERDEALELCKTYDGKKPRALELFLKITKMSDNEFYNIVEKHVVSPHKPPPREELNKKTSNIKPKDLENWIEKF